MPSLPSKPSKPSNTAHIKIVCEAVFEIGTLYAMVVKAVEQNTDGQGAQDIQNVCIDMQWIEYLHSPSLAELVRIYVHLKKKNIELTLQSLNRMNRSLLEISRLDTLISTI